MFCSFSTRRELALHSAQRGTCVRIGFATLLGAMMLLGVPMVSAQSSDTQQNSQDVAEAARQARARKQQAAGERHVYTNEDLRRSNILTLDDQARAAAANSKEKERQLTPSVKPETQPLDANSATPQEPLGDVARRYRNARKISPFHLPTNQPQLASPKIVAPIPELKAVVPAQPQPPARDFVVVKPNSLTPRVAAPKAPVFPAARAHRIDPFVGRRSEPVAPSNSYSRPIASAATTPRPSVASPMQPGILQRANPKVPPVLKVPQVIVQPGDTLWNLSRRHLGRGARWLELMAANPNLPDPARLAPGTVLSLPAKAAAYSHANRGVTSVTVQSGDTLSKLALETYGRASLWSCIAQANPALASPDRLAIGQVLTLPSSCR